MAANPYQISTWGQPLTFDFKTPSGQTCLIRRLEVDDLVDLDILSEIDRLSTLVNSDHIEPVMGGRKVPSDRKPKALTAAQKKKQEDESLIKLMSNKDDFRMLSWVIDRVVTAAVVQPVVVSSYTGDKEEHDKISLADRDPDSIYTDSIPFQDRMEIFNSAIGRMDGLARFRDQQTEVMGDVESKSGDEMSSERDAEDLGEHPSVLL